MTLYEFYGEECPHCQKMAPKVEKLEEEEGVEVEQLEVWHDEGNADRFRELDDGKCGGVPFFINTESDQWMCGETDYDTLVAWARGEEVS